MEQRKLVCSMLLSVSLFAGYLSQVLIISDSSPSLNHDGVDSSFKTQESLEEFHNSDYLQDDGDSDDDEYGPNPTADIDTKRAARLQQTNNDAIILIGNCKVLLAELELLVEETKLDQEQKLLCEQVVPTDVWKLRSPVSSTPHI